MNVSILIPKGNLNFTEIESIKSILRAGHEINLVLRAEKSTSRIYKSNKKKTVLRQFLHNDWSYLIKLERRIGERLKPETKDSLGELTSRRYNLLDQIPELNDSEVIEFEPIKLNKYDHDITDSILKKISEKSDVLILIGFNKIIKGNALNCTKFGILSTHPADIYISIEVVRIVF